MIIFNRFKFTINTLIGTLSISRYQRIAIIIPVLLLSGLFAIVGSARYAWAAILILTGITLIMFLLKTPALGFVGIVSAGLIIRFEIGTGTNSGINVSILTVGVLVALWIMKMVVNQNEIRLVRSRTNAPVFFFVLVSLLAFINGQLPWYIFARSAPLISQLGELFIILFSLGIFLVVVNQLNEILWIKRVTWVFLLVGSIYLAGRIVPSFGQFIYTYQIFRPGGFGALFWVWFVSLSFSQSLINKNLLLSHRLLLISCVIAALYVGLAQEFSFKSIWLPPIISMAVIILVALPKLRVPIILTSLLILLVYLSNLTKIMTGSENYSILTRFEAWKILAEIIKVNPILGLGPANYYFYTPLFSILGYYVQFNSHNNYIDIVAQTGILGLICFLWFVWEVWKVGWRLKDQNNLDSFSKAYVIGALGGLIGTLASGMLGDWIIPFVYNIGFNGFRASVLGWLFLGGLVALDKIVNMKSEAS